MSLPHSLSPPPPPHSQVSQLLDAMELGQYRDSFSKENVCGEILLECDNEILKSDLGMVSRLHRVRIMKVTSSSYYHNYIPFIVAMVTGDRWTAFSCSTN